MGITIKIVVLVILAVFMVAVVIYEHKRNKLEAGFQEEFAKAYDEALVAINIVHKHTATMARRTIDIC